MELLNVDTLDEAREKVLAAVSGFKTLHEKIEVTDGIGRVLAEDVVSKDNVPCFNKSTVDGYAVRAKDTYGITESIPAFFEITESIAMGREPGKAVGPGEAAYIPTGGMLPEGADAVVMVEHSEKFRETKVALYAPVSAGRNVIREGEDISEGQTILKAGTKLRPQDIGVLTSAGVSEIEVFRPWKISVISTGDEIIDVDQPLIKGKTRDINTYSVSASAEKDGFDVLRKIVLKDDRDLLKTTIARAMEDSDIVAVSGGSSQGDKDHTAEVMGELSDEGVFTHGIAIKPGKPTIIAYDKESRTLMMGLPGHPVAAMLIFELIIAWCNRRIMGQPEPFGTMAQISENVPAAGGKVTCLLVRLEREGDTYKAVPVLGKSGLMTMLSKADGYTLIGGDKEGLKEGESVDIAIL